MREIKFRGQRKDNGEWVEGGFVCDSKHAFIVHIEYPEAPEDIPTLFFVEVIPETIGQYTGLKDENGREIYEDDLYKDAKGVISRVRWGLGEWSLFPVDRKPCVRSLYWQNICEKTKGKAIGNIHQNPELLEEK